MIVTHLKRDTTNTIANGTLWQYDYGQILSLHGLDLPPTVEVHFSLKETDGETIPRIGTTKDGVTEVAIPDSMLEGNGVSFNFKIYAFVYLADETAGETVCKIIIPVTSRPKPQAFETPEEEEAFRASLAAIVEEAINEAEKDVIPHIGENGNWFVGETDTGFSAKGDGKSAYQYAVDGGYEGTEAEFAKKLAEEGSCSNTITNTANGESIVLRDSAEGELEILKVYDKSTQDGNVEVEVYGKNLWKPDNVIRGLYMGGGKLDLSEEATVVFIECKPNTTYTISKKAGERFFACYTYEFPVRNSVARGEIGNNTGSSITITTDDNAKYLVSYVHLSTKDTISLDEMLDSVQIEVGNNATTYESYKEPEILTIPLGISAEELTHYKAHTNYPTTTILSEAHLEVKYGADTKNYIDQKIAELSTAMIALGGV